jgi:hypothetical protein
MALAAILWAALAVILGAPQGVAADSGDDFSNNLFSDIAPYVHFGRLIGCLIDYEQAVVTFRRTIRKTVHERVK